MKSESIIDPPAIAADMQANFLRALMGELGIGRQQLADMLLVKKRTLDSWLLPPESQGFRSFGHHHFYWATEFLRDALLEKRYPVTPGLAPPGSPITLPLGKGSSDEILFPAFFRHQTDGITAFSAYSFESSNQPRRHITKSDDPQWIVMTAHLDVKTMHFFVNAFCQFKPKATRDGVRFCKFDGTYFTLIPFAKPAGEKLDRVTVYNINELDFNASPFDDMRLNEQGKVLKSTH